MWPRSFRFALDLLTCDESRAHGAFIKPPSRVFVRGSDGPQFQGKGWKGVVVIVTRQYARWTGFQKVLTLLVKHRAGLSNCRKESRVCNDRRRYASKKRDS